MAIFLFIQLTNGSLPAKTLIEMMIEEKQKHTGNKKQPDNNFSRVQVQVSKPFYMNDNVILYCGDALFLVDSLPPIDLFITSPPYNLGNNHHTGNIRHLAYDDNLPEDVYQQNQIEILDKCYDRLTPNGSMLYNHKNRIKGGVQITPYEWLLKTKFIIKQEIVWFNGSQNFDKIRFYPMTERVYWLAKSPETKLENNINHHDLFDWQATGTDNEHTRAFPAEFVIDMLKCFPNAKTICDPYCGSGTTIIVSEAMGRKAIGIEKEEKYCKLIKKKLQQEGTLFENKAC